MRIREAQKHTDPDPHHWLYRPVNPSALLLFMERVEGRLGGYTASCFVRELAIRRSWQTGDEQNLPVVLGTRLESGDGRFSHNSVVLEECWMVLQNVSANKYTLYCYTWSKTISDCVLNRNGKKIFLNQLPSLTITFFTFRERNTLSNKNY